MLVVLSLKAVDVGQVLGGSAQPMAMPAMTWQLRGASGAVLGAGGRVLGGRPPLHCPGLPVGGAAGPALPLLAISRVVRQMERGKGQGARGEGPPRSPGQDPGWSLSGAGGCHLVATPAPAGRGLWW